MKYAEAWARTKSFWQRRFDKAENTGDIRFLEGQIRKAPLLVPKVHWIRYVPFCQLSCEEKAELLKIAKYCRKNLDKST